MFDWDDDEHWRFRGRMSGREAPNHNSSRGGFSGGGSYGSCSKHARGSGPHASKPSRHAQRAVVQTQLKYADGPSGKGTARHLTYVQRDGAGRDDEQPQLFGPEGDELDRDDFLARSDDDEHQFRVILSPEHGHDLDMEEYVDDWMERVEYDLQQNLDWAGAVHHNTESPHAHIVIRGRDRNGERVFMAPDYMNNGLRHRAREVATAHLGPRTPSQIERAHEKQATLDHYTELDAELESASDERNEIRLADIDIRKPGLHHSHLRARLHHLEDLGLARRNDDTWRHHPALSERLHQLARQKDVLRRLREAGRDQPDRWDDSIPGDRLVGRVADRGVADELEDQPYVVVDGEDGRTRYIEPESGDTPRRKDLVVMKNRGSKLDVEPIDEPDLERAIHADGPTWLDQRLVSDVNYVGKSPLGDAIYDATERRRGRLASRGLVDQNKKPPADLLKRLRADERKRYASSLAKREGREVCRIPEDRSSFTGELSDRSSLRGGDVFVVRNDDKLAVVPANKYLDEHSQSRVRIERSKNASGRLRTYVTALPDKSRDR